MLTRSLRPHRLVLDRGDEHWRPAKLLSLTSVRVYIATGFVRTKSVTTVDLPNGATSTIGAPLAVRISNVDADSCTVVELRGSHWADAPRNEVAAATDDGVWPVIPRDITNEPLTWWEE